MPKKSTDAEVAYAVVWVSSGVRGGLESAQTATGLLGRSGIGASNRLFASGVCIIKAHDIVLAQIGAGLHFHDL